MALICPDDQHSHSPELHATDSADSAIRHLHACMAMNLAQAIVLQPITPAASRKDLPHGTEEVVSFR